MQAKVVVLVFLLLGITAVGVEFSTKDKQVSSYNETSLKNETVSYYEKPLKPNSTALHTECCAPQPFVVRTNKYGLRDDEFTIEKPEDSTRILVVGDAYTWGFGVNNSERYTEFLEKKLNNGSDREYEVINAGVPNWGMENYYRFLKYRGLKFQPDMVVIGFIWNDRMSKKQLEGIHRKAVKTVENNTENRNISESRKADRITKVMSEIEGRWYMQNPVNTSGFRYLTEIHKLLEGNDIQPVYYAIDNVGGPETHRFLQRWEKHHNATLIYRPPEFTKYWSNKTNPKYHVARHNSDPSRAGHKLLAEKLYKKLKVEFKEES